MPVTTSVQSTPGASTQAPPTYTALALQTTCQAVNRLNSRAEARKRMATTIAHLAQLISGSKGFITAFNGTDTRLVVLPEYFLTGFPMGESIEGWSAKACLDMDGPEYDALGRIAQDNALYLCGNAYELDRHFPDLYFQTSFILNPGGDVILRYRRLVSMFAPTPHDVLDRYLDIYGAEALFPVADTEIGCLAAVASEEILYPEITRALALRGAEVICHSSSEVGSPLATPKNIAKRARAYENMVYVVSANSAGIAGIAFPGASTDGHSQVVDPHGRVLGEAAGGESMCGNGEIELEALRWARRRPGMANVLARQRLELFASTYAESSIYPANNMLAAGEPIKPERSHFMETQRRVIAKLIATGVIKA
ncbi:nitrilase [Exilibacterium tricleocarpae]|uniref:Nitrilase n=1 Tax=Exilibacterium tricleocarpae TaxID=2591008 RepID=A0A545TVK0_9GAMM|nr:nitrilase-related carbon-nitrogen hydrolase [Exilibacterium tricleocarpae]TQV81246.1 nitrilase [Exilibacterium tricleocarpae]